MTGKIVICIRGTNSRVEKGETVRQAGGTGMILANDESTGNEVLADAHVLPATHISYSDGVSLLSYIKSAKYVLSNLNFTKAYKILLVSKSQAYVSSFQSFEVMQ